MCAPSDHRVAQDDPQQACAPDPYARPWRREAARRQAAQIILVGLAHDPRRTHRAAWRAAHDGVGALEMLARARHDRRTGAAERAMRQDLARLARRNPRLVERFTRQIEPADLRILVEVAQNIGELKRTPEMVGEPATVLGAEAEDLDRQAADRAGDAVAIKIKGREAGRPDIRQHVHLHAVDDGEEIRTLEPELADRL